ncbi:NAD-dependent epimerase [Planctomycetaceae bacterium SH139]
MSKYLVTGTAGFIGFALAKYLLERGYEVVGVDNFNDYYSVSLKEDRARILTQYAGFRDYRIDLADAAALRGVFSDHTFDRVVHLAAQAGVRYSIEHPEAYVQSNLVAFLNVLECCRHAKTPHLTYASSSSVYGANTTMPFSVHQNVDHPVSFYAATKKANELMAHTYSHLYGLPTTGLRFFTVYGPWGRPDMALFLFTKAIFNGEPIKVFNEGRMQRDFTYIDDIVEGVFRSAEQIAAPNPDWSSSNPDPGTSRAPFRVYNIGNNQPVELSYFIQTIEQAVGRPAIKELLPMQPGDVLATFADIDDLTAAVGFRPATPIEQGVESFVQWYREYYGLPSK